MAVVYLHYKKDNNELFYVGIGKSHQRAYSQKSRNKLWRNIVEKHGYKIVFYKKDISIEEAKSIEIYLIKKHGRIDNKTGTLCNLTDGGDGQFNMSEFTKHSISKKLKGCKLSKETIEKLKNTNKKLWTSDAYAEKRHAAKIRAIKYYELGVISRKGKPSARKGVVLNEQQKAKISKNLKDYYATNEPHNKTHHKVIQKTKDGVFVKIWESHHEASKSFDNKNAKNLIKACRGIKKSYMGYRWEFFN